MNTSEVTKSNRRSQFGNATVWTMTANGWSDFMVLPVRHAAELATSLRAQGKQARVTF